MLYIYIYVYIYICIDAYLMNGRTPPPGVSPSTVVRGESLTGLLPFPSGFCNRL